MNVSLLPLDWRRHYELHVCCICDSISWWSLILQCFPHIQSLYIETEHTRERSRCPMHGDVDDPDLWNGSVANKRSNICDRSWTEISIDWKADQTSSATATFSGCIDYHVYNTWIVGTWGILLRGMNWSPAGHLTIRDGSRGVTHACIWELKKRKFSIPDA